MDTAALTSSAARAVVVGSSRLASTRLAKHPPVRELAAGLSNRCVPWLARSAFRPGVHQVNGALLTIPEGATVGAGGEYYMALGTYEMGEIAFVRSRLPVGGGMIDVGAHIGYFTMAAAAAVGPTGRVIGIEPTATSAAVLKSNIELNGFADRVTVFEGAASDHTGTAVLHVSAASPMFNTLEPDTLTDGTSERSVPVTTLDDLMDDAGWPALHLLKMDVEGHECSVLAGAGETLERYRDLDVLFEASGTSDDRFKVSLDTITFLAERGFAFSVLDDRGGTRPADVAALEARMHMPRWQDALFNVVARRPT